MPISRRDFLMRVGQAGGYSAAFATMQSLGLIPMKGAAAEPIRATPGIGKGVKVVVLGGVKGKRSHQRGQDGCQDSIAHEFFSFPLPVKRHGP
jgi:hypothetical protein